MKRIICLSTSLIFLSAIYGCAATPSNNDGAFMYTTGNYQAQDTDTEQNGQQEFQGQLDYLQDHQEQQQQQQQQGNAITNTMDKEYQQQIQQQTSTPAAH